MNTTPSTPAPEVIDEMQIQAIAESILSLGDDYLEGSDKKAERALSKSKEMLRSFASRIISAERQAGWKECYWYKWDDSLYHYKCGSIVLGRVKFTSNGLGNYHVINAEVFTGAADTFMPERGIEEAKLWVEQEVIKELNSLRQSA